MKRKASSQVGMDRNLIDRYICWMDSIPAKEQENVYLQSFIKYIVLYCIVLYCIVLYCIVLYCIMNVLKGYTLSDEICYQQVSFLNIQLHPRLYQKVS